MSMLSIDMILREGSEIAADNRIGDLIEIIMVIGW